MSAEVHNRIGIFEEETQNHLSDNKRYLPEPEAHSMKLTVVWHKPCWPASQASSGFAARGGLPLQLSYLSELLDAMIIVGPTCGADDRSGETPLTGKNMSVIPLTDLPRSPWLGSLMFPFWFIRNGWALVREIARADAVFAVIPTQIGITGLILALVFRKPLLTRQTNSWSDPRLMWRLERALLERVAGGRNVVFATGGADRPPSQRNRAIRWLHSTTMSEEELAANAIERSCPSHCNPRLIVVGREAELKGTRALFGALSLLVPNFPDVTLDVVGNGAALPQLRKYAAELQLGDRITFHGSTSHEPVLALLRRADLFCLPARETEGFRQAVHEALACGLPVVATQTSVVPALLERDCIKIVEQASPEALAAGVRACLSDPERYRRMSADALQTARPHSLECFCETIRLAIEEAWGPLRQISPNHTEQRMVTPP